jgi:hypothetical protein
MLGLCSGWFLAFDGLFFLWLERVPEARLKWRSLKISELVFVMAVQTGKGLAEAPPFTLADIKNAIPADCFKKDTWRSMAYLARDVAVVVGLAAGAYTLNQWYVGKIL